MLSIRRLAAAAAAALAVAAVLPAPATAAAPTDVPFTLTVPEFSFSTTGSAVPLVLAPNSADVPSELTDVQIDVDTTGLAAIASVTVPGRSVGTLNAASGWRLPDVFVKAETGAAVGASGALKVTLSADGYEPIFAVATLTVNEIHVYAGPPTATYTVTDGTEVAKPVLQFTSIGANETTEMTFRIVGDPGLVFDDPKFGELLCWRNTSEVRFVERFCDYTSLWMTPGSNWQIPLTETHAPGAEAGDKFQFRATYWLGTGARNVVNALKKQTGMQRGTSTRGLYPPTKLPDGEGGPFGTESSSTGTIAVGSAPTTTAPTTTAPTTTAAPTTAPATAEPAEPPATGVTTTPAADGGVAAPGAGGGSGGGVALPTTGANVMMVAGFGVILLAGGVGAFVIARRRRMRFSA